jgi:molybdopterin adenylyltransferase
VIRVAVVTISDWSYRGEREDTGGPLLGWLLVEVGARVAKTRLIPDEQD